MKNEKLSQALGEIREDFIDEAACEKPKRFPIRWVGAIAAVLAVAILTGAFLPRLKPAAERGAEQLAEQPELSDAETQEEFHSMSTNHNTFLLAAPEYPQMSAYPSSESAEAYEGYDDWWTDQRSMHDQPAGYADNLQSYFASVIPQLLAGESGENITCSPLNIYMALAILAETTDGESRQQILELLQADSIEALREQAGHIWQAHYNNDGLSTSILGSSLWLDEGISFNEGTVNNLADYYYASVFRGDLSTEEMSGALRSWLNEQTGGLLEDQVQNVSFPANAILGIATTILYKVQWRDEFFEEFNTESLFHGINGDTTETFMHTVLGYGPYYWSDNFGAVHLGLEDGSRMWLILPDEGKTPEEILASGEVSRFFSSEKQNKTVIVNLALPKFDICSDMDLVEKLKELGITDVFDKSKADFSPILLENIEAWVDQVKHAARVAIDEKGVTAAAYTVILECGAAMPPEEEIDFTLDRPFLFYVESQDGLPLFTGIVNEP